MKNATGGFTLIELLIVIAIIGILAAVLIPNLLGARKRAYDTAAQSCAKSFQTVQATFQIDYRAYGAIGATGTATPPGINTTTEGINSACKEATMQYVTNTAATGDGYNVTFWDTRGANAFTATENKLERVAVPTSGGAAIP